MILNILLAFPYFSFKVSFLTNPIEVPETITNTLCPAEYNRRSNIPHKSLPCPATTAKRTIRTGVEHGDEKTPPKTPAISEPI